MYDLCSGSIEQSRGKLPQNKNLEEILKQELAWTLEQVYKVAIVIVIINMIFKTNLSFLYFVFMTKCCILDWRGGGGGGKCCS